MDLLLVIDMNSKIKRKAFAKLYYF